MFLLVFLAVVLGDLATAALVGFVGNALLKRHHRKEADLRAQAMVELSDGSDVSHSTIIADVASPNKSD